MTGPEPAAVNAPGSRLRYFVAYLSYGDDGSVTPGMGEVHLDGPIVGMDDVMRACEHLSQRYCSGRKVILTSWRRFEEARRG